MVDRGHVRALPYYAADDVAFGCFKSFSIQLEDNYCGLACGILIGAVENQSAGGIGSFSAQPDVHGECAEDADASPLFMWVALVLLVILCHLAIAYYPVLPSFLHTMLTCYSDFFIWDEYG